MNRSPITHIILFDGTCVFCNRSVRFIHHYDPHGQFLFASLNSPAGRTLRQQFGIAATVDSLILLEGNRAYTHSEGALRIARRLVGLWPAFYGLMIFPASLRDGVYRFWARHRYRVFGRYDANRPCPLPSPELRARFIADGLEPS